MSYKINLCDEQSCTQCFACQQACPKHCISRKEAGAGFFVPEINRDVCIECGACMKACHKLEGKVELQDPHTASACWTHDLVDREHSSSGGAFSVMAKAILHAGGVVFGATMDTQLRVRHIMIDKVEDIRLLQGSKYLQSEITDSYQQVRKCLKEDQKVLFTGTPCQVAGLYAFLKRKPENLYTCDVVCHGVPSQKAFDIWTERIGIRSTSSKVNFRFTKGWGFQMSRHLIAPTKAGDFKKLIYPNKGYYLRAFTSGLMFNEACYSCPYAQPKRVSDVTIADYWGLGTMKPFNHPTHKGVSLLLVNNEHGEELLKSCGEALYREERPMEEAIKGNGNLENPSSRPHGRDTYYQDSIQMDVKALQKKYHIQPVWRDYMRLVKQEINSRR